MIITKAVYNVFIFGVVFAYDIEYYPSQSFLDGAIYSKVLKKRIENKVNNRKLKLREFEPDRKPDQEKNITKRAVDPVFHGYPKTQEELWHQHFLNETAAFDQTPSLIKLLHNITLTYLKDCTPLILYDSQVKSKESYLFQNLLKGFPLSFLHGYINESNQLQEPELLVPVKDCMNYIVFLTDVKVSAKILGKQSESKVIVVARSSQWAVQEFLAGSFSRMFVNLLVIGHSFKDGDDNALETPYILYTHQLYTDGLGASRAMVLASWSQGKYSRDVNLFPLKMTRGYAGHRFVVAAANQPPFVFRKVITDLDGGNPRVKWDGIEIRLLKMISERNNFSIEIREPHELHWGPGPAVIKEIMTGRADIGVAGMYQTTERFKEIDLAFSHSQDCAVFITLMSTALPRYRAILGPFHWHVWVALTFTYLFGMFPLAFSDKHTLRHLIHNSGEVENMFWYVFGTFTNCFTFVGKNSWSKTDKLTTRLLIDRLILSDGVIEDGKYIWPGMKMSSTQNVRSSNSTEPNVNVFDGWYWIFTIIITSCYTGSIIAFVTLPIFPETVDTIDQLLDGFYRVDTLDRGGWEKWFINSSDPKTYQLMKKLDVVASVEDGINNVTKAFFWPHAFLGSQAELEYLVQANFSAVKSKRSVLHISNECFVPFGVSIGFPKNSLYTAKLSNDVRRIFQSGLMDKIVNDVKWEMQRTSAGQLLAAGVGTLKIPSAEEKGLSLEDTQGMFLLLAVGFLVAATALVSEWMGGFTKKCRYICKQRKERQITSSREELLSQSGSNEVKVISGSQFPESRIPFDAKPSSAGSRDTLEGEVIHVTEETIVVHERSGADDWDSRRSSSIDVDREVDEIFEKDRIQKGIVVEDVSDDVNEERNTNVSKGAFGAHLTNSKQI